MGSSNALKYDSTIVDILVGCCMFNCDLDSHAVVVTNNGANAGGIV